jgi:hypothetical protein
MQSETIMTPKFRSGQTVGSLAGSGLSDADEIATAEQDGDRLGLYRGGRDVPCFRKRCEDRLCKPEAIKRVQ